jgi:hypothetical protein
MTAKISKSNDNTAFFNARLDDVRMSGHERVKAKAHLAQAEAMAEAIAVVAGGAARLLRTVFLRPYHRTPASSH